MTYAWKTVNEGSVNEFEFIEYTINSTDAIYNESLQKGKILAPQMNRHAPNGQVRSIDEIYCKCVAGCIAEKTVIHLINDLAHNCFRRTDVIAQEVGFDKDIDEDQVDIAVRTNLDYKKIEVRSSFARVNNTFKRYNEWFSVVGCYISANKGREILKDYYITVIFNGSKDEIIKRIHTNSPVTLQIAAGCSKEFLCKNGRQDNLKNNGAKYLVIKPLVSGVPIRQLVQEIVNIFFS